MPSHILDFFFGSRISDTHLPQLRIRTPRYVGCLPPMPPPPPPLSSSLVVRFPCSLSLSESCAFLERLGGEVFVFWLAADEFLQVVEEEEVEEEVVVVEDELWKLS